MSVTTNSVNNTGTINMQALFLTETEFNDFALLTALMPSFARRWLEENKDDYMRARRAMHVLMSNGNDIPNTDRSFYAEIDSDKRDQYYEDYKHVANDNHYQDLVRKYDGMKMSDVKEQCEPIIKSYERIKEALDNMPSIMRRINVINECKSNIFAS